MPLSDAEITRRLAEKVMGWSEVPAPLQDAPLRGTLAPLLEGAPNFFQDPLPGLQIGVIGDGRLIYPWAPLESIADAWMVRDRLTEWGAVEIQSHEIGTSRRRDRVFFVAYNGAPTGVRWAAAVAEADDASSRAICLCALRAVGVEPEE
jgi:hypothetical protein